MTDNPATTVRALCFNGWCPNSTGTPMALTEVPDRPDLVGEDDKTWACPNCGALFTVAKDGAVWPCRLVCPNHPDENATLATRVYMVEDVEDVDVVVCPQCGNESQNFIRTPVAVVVELATGKTRAKNMLTGEYV